MNIGRGGGTPWMILHRVVAPTGPQFAQPTGEALGRQPPTDHLFSPAQGANRSFLDADGYTVTDAVERVGESIDLGRKQAGRQADSALLPGVDGRQGGPCLRPRGRRRRLACGSAPGNV